MFNITRDNSLFGLCIVKSETIVCIFIPNISANSKAKYACRCSLRQRRTTTFRDGNIFVTHLDDLCRESGIFVFDLLYSICHMLVDVATDQK